MTGGSENVVLRSQVRHRISRRESRRHYKDVIKITTAGASFDEDAQADIKNRGRHGDPTFRNEIAANPSRILDIADFATASSSSWRYNDHLLEPKGSRKASIVVTRPDAQSRELAFSNLTLPAEYRSGYSSPLSSLIGDQADETAFGDDHGSRRCGLLRHDGGQ